MDQIKSIPLLDSQTVLTNLKDRKNPFWPQYYAFYSTWLGGITKDPSLMVVPVDDHMVHRGDGVFEAMKSIDRKVFLMKEHLQRLAISAESIGLKLPYSVSEMQELILQVLKVADRPQTLIRLFISRGPGGFTTNPYDSVSSQMYLAITELRSPKGELYQQGVKIGRSHIPVKESWMARVKSCNYLPNVMMKKESLDRKLDFTVAFDRDNRVAESSTENIAIVDATGTLVHPPFDGILKGTTMIRTFELAKKAGLPTAVRAFSEEEILQAQEVMMIGTTLDVLPVTRYEDHSISNGQVGPVAKKLLELLHQEFQNGTQY